MSTHSPADPSPSMASSGYMVSEQNGVTSDDEEIASLPSETTADSELEELDSEYSDAEAEWRESIEQLELLLTMVLVPFVGKYLGRKCAYWGMPLGSVFPSALALLTNMHCRLEPIHGMEVSYRNCPRKSSVRQTVQLRGD